MSILLLIRRTLLMLCMICYDSRSLAINMTSCPVSQCTCSKENVISCSSRSLDRVPHFHSSPYNLIFKSLDLSSNSIESLPANAFHNIKLQAISFQGNPLIGISPRAFTGLGNTMEILDMSETGVVVMHWGVLRSLRVLRHLDISSNRMFALPVGIFDGLASLKHLTLAWNKISIIKIGYFRHLTTLLNLNLAGNLITHIEPGSFENLIALEMLNLDSNQLKQINPLSLQGLGSLGSISLAENNIQEVPSAIFVLLHLMRSINLAKNNISIVYSRAFSGAIFLEHVHLNQNTIYNVPSDAFYGLTRLKTLRLDDNQLQTLGEDCILRGIEKSVLDLNLWNNPIDCTCRIAWIHRLTEKGSNVQGHCMSPQAFTGVQIAKLNFTLCQFYDCH